MAHQSTVSSLEPTFEINYRDNDGKLNISDYLKKKEKCFFLFRKRKKQTQIASERERSSQGSTNFLYTLWRILISVIVRVLVAYSD
jgi:hypothetical protein